MRRMDIFPGSDDYISVQGYNSVQYQAQMKDSVLAYRNNTQVKALYIYQHRSNQ